MMKFKFFTNTIKAVEENNTRYIIGIASSTTLDRDNDRMSEAALQTMKSTAEANLTLYTNHEYKIPDDLFGSCVEATIKANKSDSPIMVKTTDKEEEVYTFDPQQLEIKIKVVSDSVNPKAGQIYNAIQEGVNLGFSIGGAVKKLMKVKDTVSGVAHNLIDAIDLYEISIVGIPANPDAMNLAIAKSIKGEEATEASDDDIEKILKDTEKYAQKSITLPEISEALKKQLKKDYDEFGYMCESPMSDEEKEEERLEDLNWAKAQAENILMKLGEKVSVAQDDDHTIHLRSHSYDLEYKSFIEDYDSTQEVDHIKKHLKALKQSVSTE